MLRFRKIFKIFACLLLAAAVSLPRPAPAATVPTYDLDSLCYLSTDVVEATMVWQRQSGQPEGGYDWGANVVSSLAGQYHAGDIIMPLSIGSFRPPPVGQPCFLFFARQQLFSPSQSSQTTAPYLIDILFTDPRGHVRRYFQWGDLGGLVPEGYQPPGIPFTESAAKLGTYPTVSQERANIVASLAAADRVRPLLSHGAATTDVPLLLGLLRERKSQRKSRSPYHRFRDAISETACSRLAALADPSVALDALSIVGGTRGGLLEGDPFRTDKNVQYARSVLTDHRESLDRRMAAARVITPARLESTVSETEKAADQNAITSLALAQDTPDALRLALIPLLKLDQEGVADGLGRVYRGAKSEEVQFAIEEALFSDPAHPNHGAYFALQPASGPILSIVRASPQPPIRPGLVALQAVVDYTKAMEGVTLTSDYVCTNLATGKTFRLPIPQDVATRYRDHGQIPLPKSWVPGRYRVAIEFYEKNRLVSTGHSATLTLP